MGSLLSHHEREHLLPFEIKFTRLSNNHAAVHEWSVMEANRGLCTPIMH